jgi:6-phosphogluconolactonase
VHGDLVITDDVPGEFAHRVVDAFASRPDDVFSIALSGGETARSCYERLADEGQSRIDWWKVDVYWGDERCVPADHPASNFRLGREALLDQVGVANAYYPMRCEEGPDPYQLRIGELGRFDVVHLGLGADGHTASLFAGSPALEADEGRLVVMNRDPSGTNPHGRMTLTFAGISRARLILVTVCGDTKRAAFAAVRRGDDVPAGRIRAGHVVWLVDPAAAGED